MFCFCVRLFLTAFCWVQSRRVSPLTLPDTLIHLFYVFLTLTHGFYCFFNEFVFNGLIPASIAAVLMMLVAQQYRPIDWEQLSIHHLFAWV